MNAPGGTLHIVVHYERLEWVNSDFSSEKQKDLRRGRHARVSLLRLTRTSSIRPGWNCYSDDCLCWKYKSKYFAYHIILYTIKPLVYSTMLNYAASIRHGPIWSLLLLFRLIVRRPYKVDCCYAKRRYLEFFVISIFFCSPWDYT